MVWKILTSIYKWLTKSFPSTWTLTVPSLLVIVTISANTKAQEIFLNYDVWPPYFLSENHIKGPGLATEIVETCFVGTNYVLYYDWMPKNEIQPALQLGDGDIWVFEKNSINQQIATFTQVPVFRDTYGVVSIKGGAINISSLTELAKTDFAIVYDLSVSNAFQNWLKALPDSRQPMTVPNLQSLLSRLLTGKVTAVVGPINSIMFAAEEMGSKDQLWVNNLKIRSIPYYLALSKASNRVRNSPNLLFNLNKCLNDLKDNGDLTTIQSKYQVLR